MRRVSPLWLVYLTVFIDFLGLGLILPVLPFYAQEFGATGIGVGATLAVYSLMQFVGAPVLGSLSDRFGRRPVLLLALSGTAISLTITGFATSLWMLIAGRALSGLFGGAVSTAQAYVADLTGPSERAKAMGRLGSMIGFGFIVGPAFGAALAPFGYGVPAFFGAALAALNLVAAWFILPESRRASAQKRAIVLFPIASARRAFRSAVIRNLLLATAMGALSFAGVQATFPLLGELNFGLTTTTLGIVFAAVGVMSVLVQGGVIGSVTSRFGERNVAIAGLAITGVGTLLLPTVGSLLVGFVLIALLTLGQALANPSLNSLLSREAPTEERGAILGVGQSFASLARGIGPFLAGFLFDTGPAWPYAFGGVIVLVGAAFLLRLPTVAQAATPTAIASRETSKAA